MGFTMHFNIIFGTNLLTQSPVPVSVFSLFLSFTKKEYQTESNWRANFWWFFMYQKKPTEHRRWTGRVPSRPWGWRARPLSHGRLGDPPDVKPTPKIPTNTETPRKKPRSGVPPPQASVTTKNQSGPCSGTLPEGDSITEASTYTLLPLRWSMGNLPQTYGSIARS